MIIKSKACLLNAGIQKFENAGRGDEGAMEDAEAEGMDMIPEPLQDARLGSFIDEVVAPARERARALDDKVVVGARNASAALECAHRARPRAAPEPQRAELGSSPMHRRLRIGGSA